MRLVVNLLGSDGAAEASGASTVSEARIRYGEAGLLQRAA